MALNLVRDWVFPQSFSHLFIILLIASSPYLTYQISTFLFYRTARSPRKGKRPPTVPYWVPGIFHGLSIKYWGPSSYFSDVVKEYGAFTPFVVRAGFRSFLVIREPDHIKVIFESNKQMSPKSYGTQSFGHILGWPKDASKAQNKMATQSMQSQKVNQARVTVYQKYLSDAWSMTMAQKYISVLRRNLADKMFQDRSWTEIEDMWSFFQIDITRALIETIFGPTLLKKYPGVARDFWEFDSNSDNFTRGLPRFTIPSAYNARDRLWEKLQEWLQSTYKGQSISEVEDDISDWDANFGSRFFQTRTRLFTDTTSGEHQARAAETLSVMQQSISNTVPSILWSIFETIRDPTLSRRLSAETQNYFDLTSGEYKVAPLTTIPIIQSMYAEIARLRIATCVLRTCEAESFHLDDNWIVPKGTTVAIFSHGLGQDNQLWAKARPDITARPLEKFWPERFLVPENNGSKDKRRGTTSRFSTEGFEPLQVAFGGGENQCPGREFAKAVQASTLAILFNEYEIQLSDPQSAEQSIPPVRGVAYGTIKPLDKVRVRIRKRTMAKY